MRDGECEGGECEERKRRQGEIKRKARGASLVPSQLAPVFLVKVCRPYLFDEAEGRARKIRSGDKLGEKWRR